MELCRRCMKTLKMSTKGCPYSQGRRMCEVCGQNVAEYDVWALKKNEAVLDNRSNIFAGFEHQKEASIDYNRSLELHPNDPQALFNRGLRFLELERYEEALRDYDLLLKLQPNDSLVLASRGDLLHELGRYEEALRDYNHSLDLSSDDTLTLEGRGDTLSALGRYEEALNDYNRSLELEPDNPDILKSREIVLRELKRCESVKDTDGQCDLDWLRSFRGLYEEAVQLSIKLQKLDKGITLSPRGSVSNMSVETRDRLKEFQDSFANLEKSLSHMPKQSNSDLRKISRDFQDACRNYSGACRGFIAWGERPTKFNEVGSIDLLKKADKDMEKVKENLVKISRS